MRSQGKVKRRRRDAGFTLVELMVVVAIIGLLATMVTINVIKSKKTANVTKAKADVKTIESAIQMFYLEENRYPDSIEELAMGSAEGGEPYLKGGARALKDPWGQTYVYQYQGSGSPPYTIGSYGEDKVPSNDDVFPAQEQQR